MGQESSEILFELIRSQSEKIDKMREDVHEIRVDLAVMKDRDDSSGVPHASRKERATVVAAGGGLGAFLATIIGMFLDYFGRGH